MKKIKSLFIIAFAVITLFSCSKDEIISFDNEVAGVNFPGLGDGRDFKGYNSADKTYYVNESFLNVPLTENKYIIDFPVRVSGNISDKDRVVGYYIEKDSTTATEQMYRLVDAVIPAGEMYGRIRFELTRDESLDNKSVKVVFSLVDSPDLKVGSNEYKKGVLNWSNMLPMFPTSAAFIRTYNCIILSPLTKLGTSIAYYSPNAHKAILDALGWPIDFWPTFSSGLADPTTGTSPMFGAYYTDFYAQKLQEYLDDYAAQNSGERLKHNAGTDNGKPIQARVNGVPYIQ